MNNNSVAQVKTDVLVLGSGLAGLLLAIELSKYKRRVLIVSKEGLFDSNTAMAQGGLAAVTYNSLFDSASAHLQDTLKSGAGLTDVLAAKTIIEHGHQLVATLQELGVKFDRQAAGQLELALEGGHSAARVLHSKDTTGKAISQALINALEGSPRISTLEATIAIDLIVVGNRCSGVQALVAGQLTNIFANQVVLATGGIGQVFERTTNPAVATGDGVAMAYRAGARLIDMEFVQFHPTALYKAGAPAFLISEAVRGAGARLIDGQGEHFAHRFHPDGELATRDVVARGILTLMQEQKQPCMWLDLRPIGSSMEKRFPNIIANCRQYQIDPLRDPIPVAPAAHYFMGGIWTDLSGATTIDGLFAIGECAAIGLHGANRLASNSLLEAGVMALRAGSAIAENTEAAPAEPRNYQPAPYLVPGQVSKLKQMMYQLVGLQRSACGLEAFLQESFHENISCPSSRADIEAANLLTIARLIAQSALERQESRGAHWRQDYPLQDDRNWRKRLYLSRQEHGWLGVDATLGLPLEPALSIVG